MSQVVVTGLDEFKGKVELLASEIKVQIKNALEDIGDAVIEEMKAEVPSATGTLKDSIDKAVSDREVIVTPSVEYAYYVENGRQPGGVPPISAIKTWVAAKGLPEGAARQIANAIAARGIEENKFVERTLERADVVITDIVVSAVEDAIRSMQ